MEINDERIPPFMPNLSGLSLEERQLVGEFYDIHSNFRWFRGANLVKNHPNQMRDVLVVTCEHRPLNDMRSILDFQDKHKIGIEWINLSNQ